MTGLFIFAVFLIVLGSIDLLMLRKIELRLFLGLQLGDLLCLFLFSHLSVVFE